MPLLTGTRLGPYEVVSPIGAGGMGEVYKARDTRLKREVALKILPESFASDPDRLARFQREAEVLASLNHPNIAGIYGLEEGNGIRALVMELVEGQTLADRIARGPIPIDEARPIAKQIAEALEAAHEQGIIHRDLKPGNIKVRPDGTVKVLDFGLAKLVAPESLERERDPHRDFKWTREHPPYGLSVSPTVTSPALMTGVGVLLGTAAYMSPEQAKGRPADKRSDIWAFGCVFYEILTGKRAFDGEDMVDVLSAVARLDPNWDAVPAEVPKPIRTLLQTCLIKDRRQRVADVSTVLFVLRYAAQLVERVDVSVTPPQPSARSLPLWRRVTLIAAALVIGGLFAGAGVWLLTRPASPPVVRTTLATSGSTALSQQGTDRDIAITPDGSHIVYRGNNQLLVRALNQLEPLVLSGLGDPRGVFTSPDGQWVGFFDGTAMKKVAITGGPPVAIAAIQGNPRGAAWSADGNIVFATNSVATGLQRVSAAGGDPTVLTKPDRARGESDHLWPEFLPGGKAVLFTIDPGGGAIENAQIAVLDLRTGISKVLVRGGSHAHYVPTGHLVYGSAGTLRAVAFDLGRLEVTGTPAPLLDGVVTTVQGAADFAVAANGSLVYVPGTVGVRGQLTVVSVDRQGHATPLPGLRPDSYRDIRVSPDGSRIALSTAADVWTYDLTRATLSRLTTDPAPDRRPLWTPDGQRIIFTATRAGYELFSRAADGTGTDERLVTRANDLIDLYADGWSADGKQLLVIEVPANIHCAIEQIATARPSDVKVLVKNDACNDSVAISPDGRWMAYESNVSGRFEVYVERYPELGNRQQISTAGGHIPVWSHSGRELFFGSLDGRQILAVAVQSGTTLIAGRPQLVFEFPMLPRVGSLRPYDLAPDGRFFVIRRNESEIGSAGAANMILVEHWTEELKRLVPTK